VSRSQGRRGSCCWPWSGQGQRGKFNGRSPSWRDWWRKCRRPLPGGTGSGRKLPSGEPDHLGRWKAAERPPWEAGGWEASWYHRSELKPFSRPEQPRAPAGFSAGERPQRLILDIFCPAGRQQRRAPAGGTGPNCAYRLPRLSGRGPERCHVQGGGIGTRGPGETQLEKDRRVIASRIESAAGEVSVWLGDHRRHAAPGASWCAPAGLVGLQPTPARAPFSMSLTTPRREGKGVLAGETSSSPPRSHHANGLEAPISQAQPSQRPTAHRQRGVHPGAPPTAAGSLPLHLGGNPGRPNGLADRVDLSDPAWSKQLRTVHARILDSLAARPPRQVIRQSDRSLPGHRTGTRRGDQSPPHECSFVFRRRRWELHRLRGGWLPPLSRRIDLIAPSIGSQKIKGWRMARQFDLTPHSFGIDSGRSKNCGLSACLQHCS